MMNVEILDSKRVFESFIKVNCDKLKFSGEKTMDYFYVDISDAVIIIPVDDDGKFILVDQYRHAIRKNSLEFPAGMVEKGEDIEQTAIRELEEETGYKAGKVEFLGEYYPAAGTMNSKFYICLATELTKTKQNLDENEYLEVKKFTLDELKEMIFFTEKNRTNDRVNMSTVLGLYRYLDYQSEIFK